MPFWRKRRPEREQEPVRTRPDYMIVQDIADHPGTAGFVAVTRNRLGYIGRTPSSVGISSGGQVWITSRGVVEVTPPVGEPWAYVAHRAGEGLTVYLPDEFGNQVTLLSGNPSDQWIAADPGKDPGDVKPRGISASDDAER